MPPRATGPDHGDRVETSTMIEEGVGGARRHRIVDGSGPQRSPDVAGAIHPKHRKFGTTPVDRGEIATPSLVDIDHRDAEGAARPSHMTVSPVVVDRVLRPIGFVIAEFVHSLGIVLGHIPHQGEAMPGTEVVFDGFRAAVRGVGSVSSPATPAAMTPADEADPRCDRARSARGDRHASCDVHSLERWRARLKSAGPG